MKGSGRHFTVAVLLFACIVLSGSCERLRGIIPEEDMVSLYADMFLADQWLRDNPDMRKKADTTLFFDPIFERYGYSFKEYDKSLVYYTAHPDRFADITSRAAKKIGDELDRFKEISDNEKVLNEAREKLHKTYKEKDFSADSVGWRGGKEFTLWMGDAPSVVEEDASDTLGLAPVEQDERQVPLKLEKVGVPLKLKDNNL